MAIFIREFLLSHVRVGNAVSSTSNLSNGVPQDSVLSPTLFNIAINSIRNQISAPVRTALFADDFTVFIPCSDPKLGQRVLQENLDRLCQWSNANGLKFSTTKTVVMLFCRKNS